MSGQRRHFGTDQKAAILKRYLVDTAAALRDAFPDKPMRRRHRPIVGSTQTELFGGETNQDGEVDLILK